jgi:hypothetical protein
MDEDPIWGKSVMLAEQGTWGLIRDMWVDAPTESAIGGGEELHRERSSSRAMAM